MSQAWVSRGTRQELQDALEACDGLGKASCWDLVSAVLDAWESSQHLGAGPRLVFGHELREAITEQVFEDTQDGREFVDAILEATWSAWEASTQA